ncbi:MAG: hypothetical protein WBQ72_17460 [Terriglobales bacterium]|jgi:hypothetical protein
MKKAVMLVALGIFMVAGVETVLGQEKSGITVKGTELNNGVVVVTVVKAGKEYELQCNQGAPGCASLKGGKYVLVELPSNHGMYDCRDVEVYADPGADSEANRKMGEYCLSEK